MKKYIIYILLFALNTIQALTTAQTATSGTYALDTSKDVGDIPYETKVTPQGALTYNVPIECYPSPSGLQPNISLVYNSMSGNGVAGMGWSIGGLSSISRVNSSVYYDGKVSAANFSDTCAFTLDGVRLVKKPGTDYLVTEQGNILVKLSNNQLGTDIRFEVFYPNGSKAVYGDMGLNEPQLVYPITRMEDKLGNYIEYNYFKDRNVYYVSEINYGANYKNGTSHFASAKFDYSGRTDFYVKYFLGVGLLQRKILTSINTYYTDKILKTYLLQHDFDGVSFLNEFNCSAENQSLTPLRFYYGETNNNLKILEKDILGYTETDSIVRVTPLKFASNQAANSLVVTFDRSIISAGRGGDTAYIYNDIVNGLQPYKLNLKGGNIGTSASKSQGLFFIDCFGDGKNKILNISEKRSNPDGDDASVHLFSFYNSSAQLETSFLTEIAEAPVENNAGSKHNRITRNFLIGDFLGEGYENIIYITHNKEITGKERASTLVYIDVQQQKVLYNEKCFGVSPRDFLAAADFNGDGVSEIYHISEDGCSIYGFDILKGFSKIAYNKTIKHKIKDNKFQTILLGDINGDGMADILQSPYPLDADENNADEKSWNLYYANGKDDFSIFETGLIPKHTDINKYFLQDINGDGLPELIINQKGELNILKNKGGIFSKNDIIGSSSITIDPKVSLSAARISDKNKRYPMVGIKGNKLLMIEPTTNEKEESLLKESINSYGVESKYNYGTLTNKEVCTVEENDSVAFPYNYLVEDIFVLKDIETSLNSTKLSSASYKYHNPVVHRQGLGFRGFEQISETDNLRNKSTIQKYNPQMFGVLTSIQTPTTIVKSDYDTVFAENKRVQLLLKKEVIQDILKGTSTTSTFNYDSYGNLTEQNVDYGDGIKSATSYQLSNIDSSTTYLLGLLKEEKRVNTRNEASSSGETIINYNSNYLPDLKKSYYENNLVSEEEYIYDASNNLEQLETRSYDSPDWLTTKYEYDELGRKVKETDPLGFATEYIYNGKSLLQSVKNHKGHTVSYEYDRWGRNSKTTYADGTTQTTLLSWETSPQGAVFSVTTQKSGEPDTKTFFDALGREIRTGSQRFDGSYLYTDNVYDELGRLKKTSLPFKSSPGLWNESTYDSYERIKTITYASGKKDSYAYNKLKVKSTIDGVESTKVYDASGEVIRITDASGSITYNLRADGQPESIVAPGDIITSFEYDKYGRQTAIIDPSAGTKKYEYDVYGNINKETDARGKVINLKYDKYGRSEQKEIVGEFSTTYKYNADNLIESEISTNGTAKSYTYDNLFRLKTQKESIVDGKWLEKTFVYQADGNIGSAAYKSQNGLIATENYEYSNGHHTELKLDNTLSIWKLTAENDLGMPVSSVTGVIDRQYTYDAYGLPTGRILKNGSNTIQDFGYQFDSKTGNLLWRKDNTRNIREDFTYDNLNRLTRFAGTTIQYNNQGNIIDHSAVGYFSYNQAKPYAIEKIEPYSAYLYPEARKQEITYNALMRPTSIIENGYKALFSYDTSGERVKMNLMRNDTLQLNRYYIGGVYEIDETLAGNTERLYLGGDAYSAAAVYVKESGSWTVNYIGRDYLGSIIHVVDQTGVVRQELSYDSWGRLRDPLTQALFELDIRLTLVLGDRGYTGHEHLPEFGLINMNARLYDPVVGRFLSPDPYVQAPDFSQNFNRYSYALNNPLRFTDPNGEFAFIPFLVAAVVGGAINWYSNGADFTWEGLSHFGIGAVAGAATLAAPGAFAYIAAGTAFSSNIVHQGFTQGWNNIDYQGAAFDGIISGVTAYGIGKVLKVPGVSRALNKLTGGITSPLLRNMANSYAVGLPLGTGMGAVMGALDDKSTVGEGAWGGFKHSLVTSSISGFGNAVQYSKDNSVNILSGRLNEDKLVYKAGLKAQDNIGGKGAVAGTAKHEYGGSLIERYQSIYGNRGLEIEYRFKDQGYGAGRLDVYSPKTNSIYDWKFGYPNKTIPQLMKTPQMIKYQNTFPDAKITIFKF